MKLIFVQHGTAFYVSEHNGEPVYIRQGGDGRNTHNGGYTIYKTLGNLLKAAQRFEQKVGYAPTKL